MFNPRCRQKEGIVRGASVSDLGRPPEPWLFEGRASATPRQFSYLAFHSLYSWRRSSSPSSGISKFPSSIPRSARPDAAAGEDVVFDIPGECQPVDGRIWLSPSWDARFAVSGQTAIRYRSVAEVNSGAGGDDVADEQEWAGAAAPADFPAVASAGAAGSEHEWDNGE